VLGFSFAVPSFYLFAQVGINTDNTLPKNAAMLDIKSTAGVHVPAETQITWNWSTVPRLRQAGTSSLTANRGINTPHQEHHQLNGMQQTTTYLQPGRQQKTPAHQNLAQDGVSPPIRNGPMWMPTAAGQTGTALSALP
jgi:hypothetical protein